MILVTGATGHFGKNVIEHLLKKGVPASDICALARDESKAETIKQMGVAVRTGDYTNTDSLLHALKGIDKLMLVSGNDKDNPDNRANQHINVIEAAIRANVKHIVYTSFIRKADYKTSAIAEFQESHVKSENFLINSGIPYTILQNGIYMEMIPVFSGSNVTETGVLTFPSAKGNAAWVLREELAEAASQVLTTPGHENKMYTLTNAATANFEDIASAITAVAGKTVSHVSPPGIEFTATLKSAGIPEQDINMFVMWAAAITGDALDIKTDTLENILGRKPVTIAQFIKNIYS